MRPPKGPGVFPGTMLPVDWREQGASNPLCVMVPCKRAWRALAVNLIRTRNHGPMRGTASGDGEFMGRFALRFALPIGMILGLPLLGVWAAGLPVGRYLAFPPKERYVAHAPFSWPAFLFFGIIIVAAILPFVVRGIRARAMSPEEARPERPFPWWGWLGVLSGICTWVLAWSRVSWASAFQNHTFTPLWLSFILVVNGLTHRKRGWCPMLRRPWFFLMLFPASALFWWFFEYLNRFVQNWEYMQVPADPWSYILRATPPFSTVLPAVYSVALALEETGWLKRAFSGWVAFNPRHPRIMASLVLLAAAAGLWAVGVFPNILFPLLWVSPLLILTASQALSGAPQPFSGIGRGDWTVPVSWSLAALVCGWFWEMWNFWSVAKWTYHIPLVEKFHVFEMPLPGYAGYLPFGLECAAVVMLLEALTSRPKLKRRS